jgi:hypothetical protein
MKLRHLIATSAVGLALCVGTPAFAQVTEAGDGSANNNTTIDDTANDFLDLLSNNAIANGDNRDNDDNGNNRDNTDVEVDDVLDVLSNNLNGDNRDNDNNNITNSVGAQQGGEVDTVSSGASNAASRGGEINNGNNAVVATQLMFAVSELPLVTYENGNDSEDGIDYDGGDNTISGSAFAAFSGIMTSAWNTGHGSQSQAGTNIAAQGTTNIGGDGD